MKQYLKLYLALNFKFFQIINIGFLKKYNKGRAGGIMLYYLL
jgi:hypothetical protein